MVCKLCDIEQVRDKFAHHLAGIVLTIVRKGQLLVMVKELLAHITFHVGTHHMALITYVVFAEALDDIHARRPIAIQGSVLRIAALSFVKSVFVIVRRICGYARSTILIKAAQIRSIKKTALYGA